MSAHEVWHVIVLGSALLGAAAAALLVLAPLVFQPPPPGLTRSRPLVIALILVAAGIVGMEWLVVH
jgi:hypothetical protein